MFGRKRKVPSAALAVVEARTAALESFVEGLFDADGAISEENFTRFESWLADHPLRRAYPSAEAARNARDVFHRVQIGCAQSGAIVLHAATELELEHGELAVAEVLADRLGEPVRDDIQAPGVFLPLARQRAARGIRVGRDGLRARLQPISGERGPEDHGPLTVTNQRVVFCGERERLDLALAQIVTLQVYSDGIALGADGDRATFAGIDGEYIGAMIRALVIALQVPGRQPGAAPVRR